MSEVTGSTTTIAALPWSCLVEIFLYIPLVERMELRKVCRVWRHNVDRCWSSVKSLSLISDEKFKVTVTKGALKITTRSFSQAERLITMCGPYLKTLEVALTLSDDFPLLSVIAEKCQRLEDIVIDEITSEAQDAVLCSLLDNNPNMKRLFTAIPTGISYKFFDHLSVDVHEDLRLYIVPGKDKKNLIETLEDSHSFQQFQVDIVENLKNFIVKSNGLKRLMIDYAPPALLKVIGEKENLECLKIYQSEIDDAFEFTDRVVPTKWHYLFSLKNLRKIELEGLLWYIDEELPKKYPHTRPITDEIIEELARHCPLLEIVDLREWRRLTDRSIRALSSLQHLRELVICNFCPARGITDKFLMYFTKIETLRLAGHENIRDAGVICLLRSCPTIRFLQLMRTKVTNKMLNTAVEETKKRTNGIILKMEVWGSRIDLSKVKNTSHLLKIVRR